MPSTTAQGAVSDYEHLTSKAYKSAGSHNASLNESDEQEYLPLKPPGRAAMLPLNHDSMISENTVPLPFAWSPLSSKIPEPSVTLTPLKSDFLNINNSNTAFLNEKVLETRDKNIQPIPVPAEWTEDMTLKPNPSLFITPEKVATKKHQIQKRKDLKENNIPESLTSKSVRFELPTSVTGDETADSSIFESASPIVVRGKELSDESPEKTTQNASKAYDPMSYSDESALEDQSLLDKFKTLFYVDPSKLPSRSANSLPQPTFPDAASTSEDEKEHSPSRHCKRKSIRKGVSPNSSFTRKSLSVRSPSSSPPRNIKSKQTPNQQKAGPQFLKSALSQYDHHPPIPCVIRESKNRHEETDYSFPFDASTAGVESTNAFARPEFNSTLKLKSELDNLSRLEVDVDAALMNTLAKSEVKRTEVNEKASALTNRQSEQFHDLVPLEASVEGLIRRQVKLKTSKKKTKAKHQPASKSADDYAPDLMEFFSPDIQQESADLSLPGVPPVTFGLQSVPSDLTFSLYRHSRMWNGINDY